MKKWLAVAVLTASLAASGAAQAAPGDMSVAAFLAKADALRAKGFMALMSRDYSRLKSEATAAGLDYRSRLKAERTAGRPSSCPPQPTRIDSPMLMAHLRGYPEGERARVPLKAAMADLFIKTWPCRK